MVALQWCVIFYTTKCISCMYTHIPSFLISEQCSKRFKAEAARSPKAKF